MRQKSHKMKTTNSKWVLGHLITSHPTSGDYDLMMGETPGKVAGPPPHLHHSFKESFLIIEGEMIFIVEGEEQLVKAGESIDITPGTLHTFRNASNSSSKWVNIHSPKGFAAFFEKIGVPFTDENAEANSKRPELIQEALETASQYDMYMQIPNRV